MILLYVIKQGKSAHFKCFELIFYSSSTPDTASEQEASEQEASEQEANCKKRTARSELQEAATNY